MRHFAPSTCSAQLLTSLLPLRNGSTVVATRAADGSWRVDVPAFRLAPYPVTRRLWLAVTGEAPAGSGGCGRR